jgi:hypothetical protein
VIGLRPSKLIGVGNAGFGSTGFARHEHQLDLRVGQALPLLPGHLEVKVIPISLSARWPQRQVPALGQAQADKCDVVGIS